MFSRKDRYFQAATEDKPEIERLSTICQRFPTPIHKKSNFWCGEFQEKDIQINKEKENENTETNR